MACKTIDVGGGGFAVICGLPRPKRCSVPGCSRDGTQLCDWKLKLPPGSRRKKVPTCDAPLCEQHTTKPAEGKDLCPPHAKAWREWLAFTREKTP